MPDAAAVLDALGDASRRSILERLAGGPLPVGVLADGLPISRPAVSQHLRVLKQAGLVTESTAGTRRVYRVNPAGLEALRGYLDGLWSTVLSRFAELAEAEATTPPAGSPATEHSPPPADHSQGETS